MCRLARLALVELESRLASQRFERRRAQSARPLLRRPETFQLRDATGPQCLDLGAHDIGDENEVVVRAPLLAATVEERAKGAELDRIRVRVDLVLDVREEARAQTVVVGEEVLRVERF